MTPTLDPDRLRQWIGREETAVEQVTPALVQRFNATFNRSGPLDHGAKAPLLIHLCLAPAVANTDQLGHDGHPELGDFHPPVALPRRMWAGGAFDFHGPLCIGDQVSRRSVIADVAVKQGRSGPLCFVSVLHHISANGRSVLTERQDIVYRAADSAPVAPSALAPPAPLSPRHRRIVTSPTLLFRYSALTFNGHRIHYDAAFATQTEGYPALIVHGPLQATALVQFAADMKGRPPKRVEYRNLSPVFLGPDLMISATEEDGGLSIWTHADGGPVSVQARALW